MPVYHAPGNHDLRNRFGPRLWKEYLGPTFYGFDYGGARFIALDTETDRHRLGTRQFKWLAGQLVDAKGKTVFLYLHEPLYPVSKHVGGSMDVYPRERDALHELLVLHRDEIGAVFAGHEHIYNVQVRDGIKYYITGGGGAPLHGKRPKGGFHHFLLVTMKDARPTIEVREPTP
jgi:3',5'-cyclic AMP phosphodiesterase CpdA